MTEVKMKRVGLRLVAGVIISAIVVISIRRQYNAAKELLRQKALTYKATEHRKSDLAVIDSGQKHDTKDPDDSLDDFIDVMPAHLNTEETEGDELTLTRSKSGLVNTVQQQNGKSLGGEHDVRVETDGGVDKRKVSVYDADGTEERMEDVDSVVYETVNDVIPQESLLSSFFGLKKFLPFSDGEKYDVNRTSRTADDENYDSYDSLVDSNDEIRTRQDGGRDLPLAYDSLSQRGLGSEVAQLQVIQDGLPRVKLVYSPDYVSDKRVTSENNDAAESDASDALKVDVNDVLGGVKEDLAMVTRPMLQQNADEQIALEGRDGNHLVGQPERNIAVGQSNSSLVGQLDSTGNVEQNINGIVAQNSDGIVGQNSNGIVGQQGIHIPIGQLDNPTLTQKDVTNSTQQIDSSNLFQKLDDTSDVGQQDITNVRNKDFTNQLQNVNSLASSNFQSPPLSVQNDDSPRQTETREQLLREKLSPEILRILLDNNLGPNFLKSFPLVWRYLVMEKSNFRSNSPNLMDTKREPNGVMSLSQNQNEIRSDLKESNLRIPLEVIPEKRRINSPIFSLPPLTDMDVFNNEKGDGLNVSGQPNMGGVNVIETSTAAPGGSFLYDNPRPLSDDEFALLRTHSSLVNNVPVTAPPVSQQLSSEQQDNQQQQQKQQQQFMAFQVSERPWLAKYQQQYQQQPQEQQQPLQQYQQQLQEQQTPQQQQYQQQLAEQQTNQQLYHQNTTDPQQYQQQQQYKQNIPELEQPYQQQYQQEQQNPQQLPEQQHYQQQITLQQYQRQLNEQQQNQQNLLLHQQPQQNYQQQEQYEQQQKYQQKLTEQQQYQQQLPEQQKPEESNQTIRLSDNQTITCPRDVKLAKTSHPVTALVAFPGAEAVWVRNILEQLFGEPTDSIYTIMADLKSGNAASVYQMGKKVAVQTHSTSDKNFERALLLISNPYAVEQQHQLFRPPFQDWQKRYLWGQTYSSWFNSSLPLFVLVYEDLVENPMAELIKITEFLGTADRRVSYECAMGVARAPPARIGDVTQITGLYNPEKRRINENIDSVMSVARDKYPELLARLDSFKVY